MPSPPRMIPPTAYPFTERRAVIALKRQYETYQHLAKGLEGKLGAKESLSDADIKTVISRIPKNLIGTAHSLLYTDEKNLDPDFTDHDEVRSVAVRKYWRIPDYVKGKTFDAGHTIGRLYGEKTEGFEGPELYSTGVSWFIAAFNSIFPNHGIFLTRENRVGMQSHLSDILWLRVFWEGSGSSVGRPIPREELRTDHLNRFVMMGETAIQTPRHQRLCDTPLREYLRQVEKGYTSLMESVYHQILGTPSNAFPSPR